MHTWQYLQMYSINALAEALIQNQCIYLREAHAKHRSLRWLTTWNQYEKYDVLHNIVSKYRELFLFVWHCQAAIQHFVIFDILYCCKLVILLFSRVVSSLIFLMQAPNSYSRLACPSSNSHWHYLVYFRCSAAESNRGSKVTCGNSEWWHSSCS